MEHALQVINFDEYAMPIQKIRQQVLLIQEVLQHVMRENEHYGKIPGTDKPTLLKPGAEKISVTFRLAPSYDLKRTDMPEGHREYEIVCTLTHIPSGQVVGQGVGSCSTMETKYRYRNVADYEVLDDSIPKDAKEKKQEYRKKGFGMKKVDGLWVWVKYKDSERQDNPDIADVYNTVLKMAKKRAHVDAVLTATAASDIFTQDMEDFRDVVDVTPEPPKESKGEAPKPKPGKKDFDFMASCRKAKEVLGPELYYQVLGVHGVEHCNEVAEDGREALLGDLRLEAKRIADMAKTNGG